MTSNERLKNRCLRVGMFGCGEVRWEKEVEGEA
jgi:hypothetical protein